MFHNNNGDRCMKYLPTLVKKAALIAAALALMPCDSSASGLQVKQQHPRILITPQIQNDLTSRAQTQDSRWLALKTKADNLLNQQIIEYKSATAGNWYNSGIFWYNSGQTWYEAAHTLSLAYKASGSYVYAQKAMDLADEMVRAQNDPDNNPPLGISPIARNNAQTSKWVAPAIAVIYDWCYDVIPANKRTEYINLMNTYFGFMRNGTNSSVQEKNGPPSSTPYIGHVSAAAWMGYASAWDNAQSQTMIDWARARFDSTLSGTLTASDYPARTVRNMIDGSIKTAYGNRWGVQEKSHGASGKPSSGGVFAKGMGYGFEYLARLVEYMTVIGTATDESITTDKQVWLEKMYLALRHSTMPSRYLVDPHGEWSSGGQSGVIERAFPVRLAHALVGSPTHGVSSYNWAWYEVPQYAKPVAGSPLEIRKLSEWEVMLFSEDKLTNQGNLPLFYTPFEPNYPLGTAGNKATPTFFMRSSWDTTAVWAAINMGTQYYDTYQHNQAGHLQITRGNRHLLISASGWKGDVNSMGASGNGISWADYSGAKNTLFFDDYGDYQATSSSKTGGQAAYGKNKVIAQEMNSTFSYIHADLSTAYNNYDYPRSISDSVNRKLEKFSRALLYLRDANIYVINDKIVAKNSSNAKGQYKKALRWHFPVQPQVDGNTLSVVNGDSKLFLQSITENSPEINTYSLANNPDNKWGSSYDYMFKSNVWRAEVKDVNNALNMPVLTVIQVGNSTISKPNSVALSSVNNTMAGSRIYSGGNAVNVVLFNNGTGLVPNPITTVQYQNDTSKYANHTLCGMVPLAKYKVDVQSNNVIVTLDENGTYTATSSGVLQFNIGDILSAIAALSHPKLLLTPGKLNELANKVASNDSVWLSLKTKADILLNQEIVQFKSSSVGSWHNNKIFWYNNGKTWYDAAFALSLAYRISGNNAYGQKALELADEMVRAQNDPDNNSPNGTAPIAQNSARSSRWVAPAIAVIFDWCYDLLDNTKKAEYVTLMNTWFNYLRYQSLNSVAYKNGPATMSEFIGHVTAAAWMGYASATDNGSAEDMIAWARTRFDGSQSANLQASDYPNENITQLFEGNIKTSFGNQWGIPANAHGAFGIPAKGGNVIKGWLVGNNDYSQLIDYLTIVKTATNEDIITQKSSWFNDIFVSMKNATLPCNFLIDPNGEWYDNHGIITRNLPVRLAFVLKNSQSGFDAYNWAWSKIPQGNNPVQGNPLAIPALQEWENLIYNFNSQSNQGSSSLHYTSFAPEYPQATAGNNAIPYFVMRSSLNTNAVWSTVHMNAHYFGEGQQYQAGHIQIARGKRHLLIGMNNWKGDSASLGTSGTGPVAGIYSGAKNTLFFDDFGDYQSTGTSKVGGQSSYGKNKIIAQQLTDSLSYISADLTTAYNNFEYPKHVSDTVNRKLDKFSRSVLYVKPANIFVVHDKIIAKNSTNAKGQYKKALRWHFPVPPTVNGSTLSVKNGNAKLFVQTVIPANPTISTSNLLTNADNVWGSDYDYLFKSNAWRAEISDNSNLLSMPVLTVMHVGNTDITQPNSTVLNSDNYTMTGARVVSHNGQVTNVVLFNSNNDLVPSPVTSVQYSVDNSVATTHTLCGMVPQGKYNVVVNGNNITVTQNNNGSYTANLAGVLQYKVGNVVIPNETQDAADPAEISGYSNNNGGNNNGGGNNNNGGGNNNNGGGNNNNNGGNNNGLPNNYYVNCNAAANGNGTIQSPYQKISYAYEAAKNASDENATYIINVAVGTYNEFVGSNADMYSNPRKFVFKGGYNTTFTEKVGKSKVVGTSKVKPVFEFYNTKGIAIEGFEITQGKSGIQCNGWSSGRTATFFNNHIHHNGYWSTHDQSNINKYDSISAGGGIGVAAGTVDIYDNVIEENIAHDFGGGLRVAEGSSGAFATVKQNIVKNNLSVGGASHGAGIIITCNGLIEHNNVEGNHFNTDYGQNIGGGGVGGGIIIVKGNYGLTTVTVNANTVVANKANSGAGIMVDEGAVGIITNNFVAKNRAYSRGGGIRVDGAGTGSYSFARVHNNTVVFNTLNANPDGNGGHALHVTDGKVTAANNLFWHNGLFDNDVYVDGAGSTLEISHTLLNDFALTDVSKDKGLMPTFYGGNLFANQNINNPKFIDTAKNWRLKHGSELVDVGTNSFGTPNEIPLSDYDGGARPKSATVDIGADEWGSGVNYDHPRIFMSPEIRAKLEAKVAANDPDWIKLKNQADIYKNYPITQYKIATAYNWYGGTIQYGYQGSEWYEAAYPLCFAYQLTGDVAYANKAVALADEMVRAMNDPDNNWGNHSPFNLANTYPSRYVGPAAALIYDYCHDRLNQTQKNNLHAIFNIWFDSTRKEGGLAYENNSHSHGNHLGGHMIGIGMLGLATLGENPRAQHMIAWARYRLDGTPSDLLSSSDYPDSYRTQNFSIGVNTWVGSTYGVDPATKGTKVATFAGGHNPQGWSYGNSDFGNHQVDFSIALNTVLDINVFEQHMDWYKSVVNALKHSMLPKRFMIDPIGDWGGNNGIAFQIGLPHRLAYLLEGTDIGPKAQYFVKEWLPTQHNYGAYADGLTIPDLRTWESLFFKDNNRASTPFDNSESRYFNAVPVVNPNGSSQYKVNPYYIMRSSWDTSAVWASIQMGSSHNTDHQHFHAGHIHIVRGKDQVLVSPSNYKVGPDGIGVSGNSADYVEMSAHKNTLYFDDWETYRPKSAGRMGGQDGYGFDRPITNEFADDYVYLRSDLSSAYNFIGWHNVLNTTQYLSDTINRKLEHFYRNYVYIPDAGKFVVFDQVKVKQSNHPKGDFERHLRWHFANEPVVNGNTLRQDKGNSRLWLTTLAPSNPQYTKYYLWNTNPDNWTNDPNLNYMFKSQHWRVEMRDPAKPLEQSYLTAMQVGAGNLAQPTVTEVLSNNANMRGSRIASAGGNEHVVLFNNGTGVIPNPIVSTQYSLPGSSSATHILCGLKSNTHYAGTFINGVISIAENQNGALLSSEGGVLKFVPANLNTSKMSDNNSSTDFRTIEHLSCFPNPANNRVTLHYFLNSGGNVSITLRNILGKEVMTTVSELAEGIQAYEFDTSDIPNGVYSIQIHSSLEKQEVKFIVSH